MSNKRTGWEICQEIINAQDLINAQAINKTNMTYKVKKRTGWEIFLKLINAQCSKEIDRQGSLHSRLASGSEATPGDQFLYSAVSNKLAQDRFFLEKK